MRDAAARAERDLRAARRPGRPRARSRCRAAGRRRAASAGALAHRASGSSSPNSTTSGLSGCAAVAARHARRVVGLEARPRPRRAGARAAGQARRGRDRAVHLDQLAGAGACGAAVDVLRDRRRRAARARSSSASASWAPLGSLVAERGEARAVEAPEALRVAPEGVDVRDLHRVDLLPQPRAGRAEVGDPGRHRDPRAGEGDDRRLGRREQLGEPSAQLAATCPATSACACRGTRRCPPCASSERNAVGEALLLGLDPLVEVALVPRPA